MDENKIMNLFKKIKNFYLNFTSALAIMSRNRPDFFSSEFDVDTWIFLQNKTKLSSQEMFILDHRLNFYKSTGILEKDSILSYFELKETGLRRIGETTEQFVVRMVKYDFDTKFGMSFNHFIDIYKDIEENNPEMLI